MSEASVKYKLQQWKQQAGALKADRYRIAMSYINSKGKNCGLNVGRMKEFGFNQEQGTEHYFTGTEVGGILARLEALNVDPRRRMNVYVTPFSDKYCYCLIDDVKDKAEQLLKDGFKPCLILESSVGNYQVILRTSWPGTTQDQSALVEIFGELNRKFGDAGISGAVHPFRIAGFYNVKESHRHISNEGKEFFDSVKLVAWGMQDCPRLTAKMKDKTELLIEIAKYDADRRQAPSAAGKAPTLTDVVKPSVDADRMTTISQTWAKHWATITRVVDQHQKWTPDDSRKDFYCIRMMLKSGFSLTECALALYKCSPDLRGRHANNWWGYIRTTVCNAANDVNAVTDEAIEAWSNEMAEIDAATGPTLLEQYYTALEAGEIGPEHN
jgi:hypothetical protein